MLATTDTFSMQRLGSKRVSKELAKQLKHYVDQSMYDKETIRKSVGVNQSTMSKHLNGKISLTYQNIKSYSKALGINIHQLIGVEPIQVIGHTWNTEDVDRIHMYNIDDKPFWVYPDFGYDSDIVCVLKKEDNIRPWLSSSIICFSKKNMENKTVTDECQETYCFIKYKVKGQSCFKLGIPYQMPFMADAGKKYTIVSPSRPGSINTDEQGITIEYACPILDWVLKPKAKLWKLSTDEVTL
jgi:predicted XRE-type DNA-binding protein